MRVVSLSLALAAAAFLAQALHIEDEVALVQGSKVLSVESGEAVPDIIKNIGNKIKSAANSAVKSVKSALGMVPPPPPKKLEYTFPGERGRGLRFVQKLHNYMDIEYSGRFLLGGQPIRGIYDTGSFELLVMSKKCNSRSCRNKKKYFDPAISNDIKEDRWSRKHAFGSGDCTSLLAKDNLELGPMAFEGVNFWEVTAAEMDILEEGTFEAIVGVSHPNQPIMELNDYIQQDERKRQDYMRAGETPPGWLMDQKRMDEAFLDVMRSSPTPLKAFGVTRFSVCFMQQKGKDGFWIWNDHNPADHPKLFTQIPITGATTWSSPLKSLAFNGGARSSKGASEVPISCQNKPCSALFDSGTSLLTAPSDVVQVLLRKMQQIGFRCDRMNEMPNLVFNVNGVKVSFPPQEYVGIMEGSPVMLAAGFFPQLELFKRGSKEKGSCTLLMMAMDIPTDEGDLYIIGMPFFRRYFATFSLGDDPSYKGDKVARSLYMAASDGTCTHPSEVGAKGKDRKLWTTMTNLEEVRTIDVSKVRIPSRYREQAARSASVPTS